MKYVTTSGSGLRFSKLAFGCAPVMGRIGKRAALRAMELAFDNGVTHFDVARSYGFGEAEGVLGAFAADKRDRVTIATKFGIRATAAAKSLRITKPIVRQIARHLPAIRSLLRKASSQTLIPGHYSLSEARKSLEESLRELRTDYVDVLFAHDCSPSDQLGAELLDYLDTLVAEGKVRAWGIATRREWIETVYEKSMCKPMIVQFEQDIFNCRPLNLHRSSQVPAILHSPFGGPERLPDLETLLTNNALLSSADSTTGHHDPKSRLSALLLEGALHLAGDNIVLCSMFEPNHILSNIRAVESPRFNKEQIAAIRREMRQYGTSPGPS